MAAPLSNDPNVIDSNAVKYNTALQAVAGGQVLWHPSLIPRDRGIIGDCGYFDGGRFQVLFNVFDPPSGLGIDPYPRPEDGDVRVDEAANHSDDILHSCQSHTIRVEANVQSPPLPGLPMLKVEVGTHAAVEDKTMAFLALCGPKRRTDSYPKTRGLMKYLEHYEPTIIEHFHEYPVYSGNLVIVHGTTRSVSWWGGVSYSHATFVGGRAEIQGTGVGLEVENQQRRSWTCTRGPETWDEPSDADRCVVLRVVSIKRRNPVEKTLRGLKVALSGLSRGTRRPDHMRPGVYSSPGGSNSAEPVQAPSSNEASTSSAEDRVIADQPSLLDHALSEVLRTNPDVDVAAGDWDAINAFTSQLRGASRSTRMYYALTTTFEGGRDLMDAMQPVTQLGGASKGGVIAILTGVESKDPAQEYNFGVAGTVSASVFSIPSKPLKQPITMWNEDALPKPADMSVNPPRACTRCKRLKVRCENNYDTRPCKRCRNADVECVTKQRKQRPRKGERLVGDAKKGESEVQQQVVAITPPLHTSSVQSMDTS